MVEARSSSLIRDLETLKDPRSQIKAERQARIIVKCIRREHISRWRKPRVLLSIDMYTRVYKMYSMEKRCSYIELSVRRAIFLSFDYNRHKGTFIRDTRWIVDTGATGATFA